MKYSKILLGKDVGKLAYKTNCESLTLTDLSGNESQYSQVVSVMVDDKIRCVLRQKDDFDFGEFYVMEKLRGKEILLLECDCEIQSEVYLYYALHCKYQNFMSSRNMSGDREITI